MTAERLRRAALLAGALTALLLTPLRLAAAEDVTLFAAASATGAVEEVAAHYRAAGGGRVRLVFAASSTLAKQIAQGAPADLFLSANIGWMDYLAEKGAIEPASRRPLLANRLVLVVPADSPDTAVLDGSPLSSPLPLPRILGERPLAIGDPAHVPAGIYAAAALEALGLWAEVAGRTVRTSDVRAALALVDRGEAAAGIVYATDARLSTRVRIAAVLPADSHPPILYPLAVVAGHRRPAVERFYVFLSGPEASAVFVAHGFLRPAGTGG